MLIDGEFARMMDVNFGGVRSVSVEALPELRKTKGNIVNIYSVSGMAGDWAMYGHNASKGAVTQITQDMALDLGADRVRINAVAPATVNRRMVDSLKALPNVVDDLNACIPMGRMGEPIAVANAMALLASEQAGFITGVVLPVDGGLSASDGQPNFLALIKGLNWPESACVLALLLQSAAPWRGG